MKKILLFAIIAFSVNAFAQNKRTSSTLHSATSNPTQQVHSTLDPGLSKMSKSIHQNKSDNTIERQPITTPYFIPLIDSIYYWKWDTINVAWALTKKTIKHYNANEKLDSEITKKREGNIWVNSSLNTYTYGSNNMQTNWLVQNWKSGDWVNFMQISTTYYTSNKVESVTTQTWMSGVIFSNKTIWTSYITNSFKKLQEELNSFSTE